MHALAAAEITHTACTFAERNPPKLRATFRFSRSKLFKGLTEETQRLTLTAAAATRPRGVNSLDWLPASVHEAGLTEGRKRKRKKKSRAAERK